MAVDASATASLRPVAADPRGVLWLLVVIWSIPTVGLMVNLFRPRDLQRSTGFWTVFNDLGSLTFSSRTTARC